MSPCGFDLLPTARPEDLAAGTQVRTPSETTLAAEGDVGGECYVVFDECSVRDDTTGADEHVASHLDAVGEDDVLQEHRSRADLRAAGHAGRRSERL